MNISELTPSGGGDLSRPVLGPRRQIVAQFTPTQTTDPADIWEPFTRTTDAARGGIQGAPLGRPGHGLEHEPVDQAERNSEHTVQHAAFTNTASQIRAALRPGNFSA